MKMNNAVQAKLREIVARYGSSVIDDPLRCQGLLNDLCPASRREVTSLILVLKEGVPWELVKAGKNAPRHVILTRLAKQVSDNIGLSEDVARWAVESWARAVESLPPAAVAKHQSPALAQAKSPNPIKPVRPAILRRPVQPKKPPPVPRVAQPAVTMPGKQAGQSLTPRKLSDAVQHPLVLIPLAICVVAALYLVFLSALSGGGTAAIAVLTASGIVAVVSFVLLYTRTPAQVAPHPQQPKGPVVNPPPTKGPP